MRRKYHHLTSPAMLSHAGYSPGRHLPRTLYLASSRLNLHTAEKKKKFKTALYSFIHPATAQVTLWWFSLYVHDSYWPVRTICACLASSQTFAASVQYSSAFAS